ncbi:MAG: aspartate/glutamate racemase family protein [Deltaproteobacteria bacterium]|nr:aspartate/glutamate racemase family protein [Deltaproteobacteria bacterium]
MIYYGRPGQFSAGEAIGILLLDAVLPLPPGDVANATTYPFPVRYSVVKAASIERLIYKRDPELLQPFIDAGWDLVRAGVKAITSDCGFMALFQEEMAEALPVPVFLSSLLQIPFIHRTLRKGEKVGIIAADGAGVTETHLKAVGVDSSIPLKIVGMDDQEGFRSAILEEKGLLDFDKVEAEVVGKARELVKDEKVRAILLECSNLPQYAYAVQQAVNLPVFDFNTLVNYVFSALIRQPYRGFV